MKQKSHLPEEVAYVYYDLLLIIPAEHAEESVFKLFSLTVRNIVTPHKDEGNLLMRLHRLDCCEHHNNKQI